MGHENRRRAVRLDCDLPVRLDCGNGRLEVRMADLSRTGLRLRVPGSLLGVHRLSSLAQVSVALQRTLGDRFFAELHYEMLGPLIRRELLPMRIGKRDWESTVIDVGCRLLQPLSDEEAGMLGVALPGIGEQHAPLGLRGIGPHVRSSDEPPDDDFEPQLKALDAHAAHYEAWIYPAPGKPGRPLRTEALSLTRGMAILGVASGQGLGLREKPMAHVVAALDEAYGADLLLRIVDGPDDLWAGPARIHEVDVTPRDHDVRLGVAFGRELRAEELGRLGLPTPA